MMFKNKHESTKPLFEYLNIVTFDVFIKLQQGKFMKQLSLDLQPESITKHFPLRYIHSINNTSGDKLITLGCLIEGVYVGGGKGVGWGDAY